MELSLRETRGEGNTVRVKDSRVGVKELLLLETFGSGEQERDLLPANDVKLFPALSPARSKGALAAGNLWNGLETVERKLTLPLAAGDVWVGLSPLAQGGALVGIKGGLPLTRPWLVIDDAIPGGVAAPADTTGCKAAVAPSDVEASWTPPEAGLSRLTLRRLCGMVRPNGETPRVAWESRT